MPLADLYREVLMDHVQHPRNRGELPDATARVGLSNPTCGDELGLDLKVEGDRIVDARFNGHGCSISMSAASMLTEAIRGRRIDEVRALSRSFRQLFTTDMPPGDSLGDLVSLAGVRQFPMRVKCATLAFNALDEAVDAIRKQQEVS